MTTPPPETRCPYCGSETTMARTLDPLLGGHLSLEEFEVLVRGEWRRVLGRAAYDRVHEARLARSLVALAAEPDSEAAHASLRAGLDQVVADLASTGAGRDAVRGEIHALFLAMYNVLTRAGASTERSAALRVASERAVEMALGYSMELPMGRDAEGREM